MVIADETKWVSYGQTYIHKVFGFNNNAEDDRYIQFHAKPAALLANGDVPALKSIWAPAAAGFSYSIETGVEELTIAISSTEVDYTAVTNTGLDLTCVVDSAFLVGSGTTLVGDLTTDVADRTIWNNAAGHKVLKRLQLFNDSPDSYAFHLYPEDTPDAADNPLWSSKLFATGTGGTYYFNLRPFRGSGAKGCVIKVADTIALPLVFSTDTDFNIMGIYDVA